MKTFKFDIDGTLYVDGRRCDIWEQETITGNDFAMFVVAVRRAMSEAYTAGYNRGHTIASATLLDEFAKAALAGEMSTQREDGMTSSPSDIASWVYRCAEACVAEREQRLASEEMNHEVAR